MRSLAPVLFVAVVGSGAGSAGCGRDTSAEAVAKSPGSAGVPTTNAQLGKERSDCRPDKSCDPGLLCLSNLCVRPPPADCQQVGETLASFEVGNYAEDEQRLPIVAKHRAACEQAFVTKDEGKCILEAPDKYTAKKCAPSLFPVDKAASGDCDRVAEAFRAAMAEQMASLNNDQRMRGFMEKAIALVGESCREDQWPRDIIDCVLDGKPNPQTLEACSKSMPKELQEKMQARMQAATKDL